MSASSPIPYIGSKISLVTNSELRYEGILININTTNSTVTLRDVRMSGTENRKTPNFVFPSSEVYDYIIFNGKDIKDLTVSESAFSVKEDPAVVAVNVAPPQLSGGSAGPNMQGPSGPDHQLYHPSGGPPHDVFAASRNMPPHEVYNHPRGFSPVGGRGGGMFSRAPGGYMSGGYMPAHYGPPRTFGGRGRGGPQNMGGMSGGGGGGPSSRAVVGELTAQPNTSLKTQVAQAFDFEQNNSKFEKEKLENQVLPPSLPYDASASFFDNISCETLNRQHGRDNKIDRDRQRELDAETFGPSATLTRGPRYYRRGYRRPVGPMRGGRGGYGGYYAASSAFGLGAQMLRAQ